MGESAVFTLKRDLIQEYQPTEVMALEQLYEQLVVCEI